MVKNPQERPFRLSSKSRVRILLAAVRPPVCSSPSPLPGLLPAPPTSLGSEPLGTCFLVREKGARARGSGWLGELRERVCVKESLAHNHVQKLRQYSYYHSLT